MSAALSYSEWCERYCRALRQLCKTADNGALDPNNSLAMYLRKFGESPEVAARYVADEIAGRTEVKVKTK